MCDHRAVRSTLAVIVSGLASGLAACAIQTPAPANPSSAEAPVAVEPIPPAPASPVPAGVAAAPASPSPAQAAAAAGVMLHSAANQAYCIDAAQDHSAKRIPVRLFTCHGGENQRWILTPDPNGVTAVAGILGQCLDIKGAHAADGTNAHMDPCNGGASQQFTYDAAGHLRDQTTGKCLTVTKEARGAPIIIEPCDPGNPGQVWSTAER
jgi:hypothetical protein